MTDQAPVLPQQGSILAGRYLVGKRLGKGAMGVVFEGVLERLNQKVAIKVLRPEMLEQPEVVARFEREARLVAKLSSPHVVRVFDVDRTEDGLPFIVMERLEGTDLARELAEHGPFTFERAVDHVRQICSGVAEAHRAGVIHRDLKPSNVFLTRHENGAEPKREVLKIVDFGISKLLGDAQLTATNSTFGTPKYMSPEQIRSAKTVDQRTDVWAIAVIFFELLAGEPPFIGESGPAIAAAIVVDKPRSLRSFRPDIPAWIEQLVMAGLAKNPAHRIQTVLAFRAGLDPNSPSEAPEVPTQRAASAREARAASDDPSNSSAIFVNAKSVSTSSVPSPTDGSWSRGGGASRRPPRPRLSFALFLLVLLGAASAIGLGAFAFFHSRDSARASTASTALVAPALPTSTSPALLVSPAPLTSAAPRASTVGEVSVVDAPAIAASSRAQPRTAAPPSSISLPVRPSAAPAPTVVAPRAVEVCPDSQKILVGSALVCP